MALLLLIKLINVFVVRTSTKSLTSSLPLHPLVTSKYDVQLLNIFIYEEEKKNNK